MFSFENAKNVTNKGKERAQIADIKLLAGNKIRLNQELRAKLGWNIESHNILVLFAGGQFAIGCVNKESKEGRPINEKGEFSNEVLSNMLSGHHSEWMAVGDPFEHPDHLTNWYVIEQTVDGSKVRAELEADALAAEEEVEVEVEENTEETSVYDTALPPHYSEEEERLD